MTRERAFLFLQGPLSCLYSEVASQLMSAGYPVFRVNFCGNDAVDWKHPGAFDFRDRPERWEPYIRKRIRDHGITDLIFHGDRRYYHLVAARVARAQGVDIAATELGYLRPDWMTLERGACSALSHFPVDPSRIGKIALDCEPPDLNLRFPGETWRLVVQELRFTLFNTLMRPRFPHYRSHRQESRAEVYAGWVRAQLTRTHRKRRSERTIGEIRKSGASYYLVALQLSGDFQIRDHSPFEDMRDAIRYITRSFCRHADGESLLIFKCHPLEYRHGQLRTCLEEIASEFDLRERIVLVDGGDLAQLSANAKGFVTVNSSAGLEALAARCPTISIMPTIYDVDGLTFQGKLDDFWTSAVPPDRALFDDFRRALAGTIQVRGTLYNPDGLKSAAREMAQRLMTRTLNGNGAYDPEPPRLARAAQMGVTYDTDVSLTGGTGAKVH